MNSVIFLAITLVFVYRIVSYGLLFIFQNVTNIISGSAFMESPKSPMNVEVIVEDPHTVTEHEHEQDIHTHSEG